MFCRKHFEAKATLTAGGELNVHEELFGVLGNLRDNNLLQDQVMHLD